MVTKHTILEQDINHSLELVQPRNTHPYITERLLGDESNSNQNQTHCENLDYVRNGSGWLLIESPSYNPGSLIFGSLAFLNIENRFFCNTIMPTLYLGHVIWIICLGPMESPYENFSSIGPVVSEMFENADGGMPQSLVYY